MSGVILESFETTGMTLEHWRDSIEPEAQRVLMHGISDPELRAFTMKLIQNEIPETEWLEALGSMVAKRPPSMWRDSDEQIFY